MTALEIALLIMGAVFLVVSFFVSEKLSASDLDEIKKMSEQEIKVILQKNLAASATEIETMMQEKVDEAMEELERKTDRETNDKIMAISEFSDTVLDSMNKSHNEIVFLYDMLHDKQEKATELTKNLQQMESNLVQMGTAIEEEKEELQELLNKDLESAEVEQSVEMPEHISMEEALKEHQKEEERKEDVRGNQEIIELYKQGMTEVEIAKKLGRGLGEIKLVLGLFHNGDET